MNPASFRFLEEGIRLNRADVVEPRRGDCRDVAPVGVADRVIMGHFEAAKYLDVAFRAVKREATIHLHGLAALPAHLGQSRVSGSELSPAMLGHLDETAFRQGCQIRTARTRFVKSYGPRRAHVVTDLSVVRR